jgi:putative phosphoesterase
MSCKIGLISDLHATPAPVAQALRVFCEAGVERIWCAGDIAGYGDDLASTVELLMTHHCETVQGNHERRLRDTSANSPDSPVSRFLCNLPVVIDTTIAATRLYMVHASPPRSCSQGIRLLDAGGEVIAEQRRAWSERLAGFAPDVLIVGHTHQVFAEYLGDTLVVNPGSTRFNHSCMILSLPERECRLVPLGGNQPIRAWNWGMETGDA